jgi:hypothetical protein
MGTKAGLSGVAEMRAKIDAFARQFPDKVGAALYLEAQIEMTESKRRCPVDVTEHAPHPGLLRSTGIVETPVREGKKIRVTLSYGTDYAVYVHEILTNFHKVGQAKFLESTLNESAPFIAARVARRVKDAA